MAWHVCIVGKVAAAQAKVAERFEEQRRKPELLPSERAALDALEQVVVRELAFMATLKTGSYVSVTAKGQAWLDRDGRGDSEVTLAVRMLPGFVD